MDRIEKIRQVARGRRAAFGGTGAIGVTGRCANEKCTGKTESKTIMVCAAGGNGE